MNLWIVFVTGLTVGGLTCLAVQGGLLASVIATKEEEEVEKNINRRNTVSPTLAFLFTKLIAHTLLGFLLGLFGSSIAINQTAQIAMQFAAGLYMSAAALNLLNVHPIFRYTVLQPPRFLTRLIRNQSRSKDIFAPAFLGGLTIFIPCGTTLAMETLAIASGNAFLGALIMGVFVLGTTPLFFGVGFLTSVMGDNFRENFLRIAALAVIYLGLTSINGALVAAGSSFTIQSVIQDVLMQINPSLKKPQDYSQALSDIKVIDGIQIVDISVTSNGYSPTHLIVRKDQPVKLNLRSSGAYSCASAFRIPSLGVVKDLQPNGESSVMFTPVKSGQIVFNCSMGMYRGVIEVI